MRYASAGPPSHHVCKMCPPCRLSIPSWTLLRRLMTLHSVAAADAGLARMTRRRAKQQMRTCLRLQIMLFDQECQNSAMCSVIPFARSGVKKSVAALTGMWTTGARRC